MKSARLKVWVDLEKQVQRQDDRTGAMITGWELLKRVPSEFVDVSVSDFIAGGAEQSQVAARVVIRYRDDVDANVRVIRDGRAYRVVGVMADPKRGREYMTLAVAAGVRVSV